MVTYKFNTERRKAKTCHKTALFAFTPYQMPYDILVDLSVSDLEIVSKDVSEVQVKIKGSRSGRLIEIPDNLTIEEVEGSLTIKEHFAENGFGLKEIGKLFFGDNKGIYVKVEVPHHYEVGNVQLNIATGDVRLNGLTCDVLDCQLKVGGLKGEGVSIDQFRAKMSAGDIKVFGTMRQMAIESSAGDIKLSPSNQLEVATITTKLGDVKLELPDIHQYTIDPSLALGEVKFKGFDKEPTLAVASNKKISVSSKVGDCKIYYSF